MTNMLGVMNPYWGKSFFEFFALLFTRTGKWLQGDLALADLASDEIQLMVLVLVSIACALVGSFLVLKKMTMLANSLSHTILLGIVLAYILILPFGAHAEAEEHVLTVNILLIASLATGLITTLLTQLLTNLMKLQEDASIGLIFTTLFAIGIVLVTLFTRNLHIGTEVIMGNVDALHVHDLKLVSVVALVDFLVLSVFFKEFKITTFDPSLARSVGFSNHFFNYLLMILVAGTAIAAFRAVGVLLVLALLVGPVLIARLLTHRLKLLIALSALIGAVCSILAVALTRHILSVYQVPLSTSGMVVCLIAFFYIATIFFAPRSGLIYGKLKANSQKKILDAVDPV